MDISHSEDIRVNWIPITFSHDYLIAKLRKERSEEALIAQKNYKDMVLYEYAEESEGEQDEEIGDMVRSQNNSGWMVFDDNSKFEGCYDVKIGVHEQRNVNPVKALILRGLELGAANVGYKCDRLWNRVVARGALPREEITSEFKVYDAYHLYPYYLYDSRDRSKMFGLVIDHKNHYEFAVSLDKLSAFINRTVCWDDREFRQKGKLLSIEGSKASVQVRTRVKRFQYDVSTVSVATDLIQPVGSVTNFYRFLQEFYPNDAAKLDFKRRVATGIIPRKATTHAINVDRLREKKEYIKDFLDSLTEAGNKFSPYPTLSTTFAVRPGFVSVKSEHTSGLAISGGRLPKRSFSFGSRGGGRHAENIGQYRGVQKQGPLRQIDESDQIVFLFIFSKGKNSLANQLYFALKNGLGSFSGIESFFKIPINLENVHSIEVDTTSDLRQTATNYKNAIEKYLGNKEHKINPKHTLAFLVAPETHPDDFPNPHYVAKAVLLKYGIVSQGIDEETILDKTRMQWSIGNIALACFAKLGGVPWRVESPVACRQLIFGIGQKELYDEETNKLKRIVGFTVCVTEDGQFRSVTTFKPSESWEEFERGLPGFLEAAVRKSIENEREVEEIILHLPRKVSGRLISRIEEGLHRISDSSDKIYPFAVLRVTNDHSYYIWDFGHKTHLAEEGYFARIGRDDALLVVPGRQERRSILTVPSKPLRVNIEASTLTTTKFDQLLHQVYALSGANWRGFNAREMPITRSYSELIADMLGHIERHSIEGVYDGLQNLKEVPWFL